MVPIRCDLMQGFEHESTRRQVGAQWAASTNHQAPMTARSIVVGNPPVKLAKSNVYITTAPLVLAALCSIAVTYTFPSRTLGDALTCPSLTFHFSLPVARSRA